METRPAALLPAFAVVVVVEDVVDFVADAVADVDALPVVVALAVHTTDEGTVTPAVPQMFWA